MPRRRIELAKSLPRRLRELRDDSTDAVAFAALAPLAGPFLPWTRFTMRPAAVLAVVNDIAVNDRRQIVECGSGNSTIYSARLLAERGGDGRITSIDHDESWAAITRRQLEREGLDDRATVVVAELRDGWYDSSKIPALADIDLLVVDGPPAYEQHTLLAREPALHKFHRSLTGDATVILDDARRPGEREVAARWSSAYGRTFVEERGGYAISAPHVVAL